MPGTDETSRHTPQKCRKQRRDDMMRLREATLPGFDALCCFGGSVRSVELSSSL